MVNGSLMTKSGTFVMNEGNAFLTEIAGYNSTDNLPIVNCVGCFVAQHSSAIYGLYQI